MARADLNEIIADRIEQAELDPDQEALLEKLLGKDYEVITADERSTRSPPTSSSTARRAGESGKAMMVCIDKITCARMFQRIQPLWEAKAAAVRADADAKRAAAGAAVDEAARAALGEEAEKLEARPAGWKRPSSKSSSAKRRTRSGTLPNGASTSSRTAPASSRGFETADGKRLKVDDAFKKPDHPFRVVIVCAMWLTGFDVESLSTLYIDKPMKAHTLMQAIARANRVWPGKDFGLIVDYNGMLRSLREALAQYALGDDAGGGEEIVQPVEERVQALVEAIEATEAHLRRLGFDPATLVGSQGFARIAGLRDAVEAVYTSDETKRRFEILARQVFARFKALLPEPTAYAWGERHDNIEAIYRKLSERRDTANVTVLLKELHRVVNEAIRTEAPGSDLAEGALYDLAASTWKSCARSSRRRFAGKPQRFRTSARSSNGSSPTCWRGTRCAWTTS